MKLWSEGNSVVAALTHVARAARMNVGDKLVSYGFEGVIVLGDADLSPEEWDDITNAVRRARVQHLADE